MIKRKCCVSSRFIGQAMRGIGLLALGFAIGPSVRAQLLSTEKAVWIHRADLSDSSRAVVFLSALNVNWRPSQEPIMGVEPLPMAPGAVEVYLDKQQIKTVRFERFAESAEGIDVVLALDISGSVSRFPLFRDAVSGFVERLRVGKDQVAILTFGTDSQASQFQAQNGGYSSFTDNIADLQKVIATPPARERTSKTVLFKAVTEAIDLAHKGRSTPSASAEKAVIVLSDGHDEGVGYDITAPIGAAKERQIPVFTLGLPEASTNNRYHDVLDRISRESGALFVPIRDVNQLRAVYAKLDSLLKSQYVLTFEVPAELRDGNAHNLQVLAAQDKTTLSARMDVRTQIQPGTKVTAVVPDAAPRKAPTAPKPSGPPPWYQRYRGALLLSGTVAGIALAALAFRTVWRAWGLRRSMSKRAASTSV